MSQKLNTSLERLIIASDDEERNMTKTDIEDKPASPLSLMDLSPELINKVVSFDIEIKYKGVCLPRSATKSGRGNLAFQGWLQATDLSLASSNYSNGFDAVKAWDFKYFSRFQYNWYTGPTFNQDVELMRKCGNLVKVSITWAGNELIDTQNGAKRPVNQLAINYKLWRMLYLPSIRRLLLRRYRCTDENMMGALEDLRRWFMEGVPS